MVRRILLGASALMLFGGLLAAPVLSQETRAETKDEPKTENARETRRAESPESRSTVEQKVDETGTDERSLREQIRERVRRAIRLPEVVQDSRDAGVSEDKIRDVLGAARERDVSAAEVEGIFEVENEAIRQGGDPQNFGAAVQQMKASGLRGRELAEAIHAEQYARGMKKPKKGKGKGKGKGKHGNHDDADSESMSIQEGSADKIDEKVRDAGKNVKEKAKPEKNHDNRRGNR